jgi:hypothetical protein
VKIISFAETTPALLAGRKTCTRRQWNPRYAAQFRPGDLVQAYDKNPRNGGKPVAVIEVLGRPVLSTYLPETDWEAEGFAYMEEEGLTLFGGATPQQVWDQWKAFGGLRGLYEVRFKVVKVQEGATA